jgi:radical SAM superfamily enzyme YgiQ (UPF0313 family)
MEKGKNVILVEPRANSDNFFSKYMTLPLMGPVYLATILKRRGHHVRVLNENLLGHDVAVEGLDCDFLCISALTMTAQRGYELAKRFKSSHPDSKVIIGGIHVSMLPDEVPACVDFIVVGEGEPVIADIVEGRITERIVKTEHIDMDKYPIPDFGLLENSSRMHMTPMITSRGCPFDCTFCSVTEMFGRQYRTLSADNVMKTLHKLSPRRVFFYDDNFAAIKSRTYDLAKRFKDSGLDFRWTCQVRTDVTNDPKLVEKMADSGCHQVYVGFESVNPATLKKFNKAQGVEHIRNSIKVFHDNGINVHGMFIFGSDEDDKRVFLRTSEFCNEHEIDSTQFAILAPLPGTRVFKEFESQGRLLHKDWQYYDALHAVFRPGKMTALELQEGMIDAFKDFYSYSRAINDAMNIFFEYNANAIRGWYSNVTLPSFARVEFKLIGTAIIRSWLKQNKHYFEFLQALEKQKQAWSSSLQQ